MTNPSIARRPFQISACGLKPNLIALRSSGLVIGGVGALAIGLIPFIDYCVKGLLLIRLLAAYRRPQKCRTPWFVNNSVSSAATKPIMARRPFQFSAWGVKPDFQALRSAGSVIGGVGAFCMVTDQLPDDLVISFRLILSNVTQILKLSSLPEVRGCQICESNAG